MNQQFSKRMQASKLLTWLFVMLLSAYATSVNASDWMKNSSKFYMSNAKDHVTFNVFLCDLDRSNTYAKSGGIYAKDASGNQKWLMDLYYKDEGSDENPYGKVYARYCIGEARAWFANGYNQTEQEIGFGGKDFLIQKWGGDNHYCTPEINFYYPASMAGRSWTFYYQYEHNNGGTYTMTLGSATLSSTLGLSSVDMSKFTMERTRPDKIKFTTPALPDDIASKLSEVHIRTGSYTVKLIYTRQNGTTVTQTETLDCEKGRTKTYELDIPTEAGNPKRIDREVTATEGVKDATNYYYKNTSTYNRTDIFPVVPVPGRISTEYRQFDKSADLTWTSPTGSNYLGITPYIYRIETDANGTAASGASWSKRGTIEKGGGSTFSFTDNSVQQGKSYKYLVLNVPTAWINNGISAASLGQPTDELLNQLGHMESDVLNTQPTMSIYGLRQDVSETDKVKLSWQYSRVPTDAANVNFSVLRKTDEAGEWAEYATVSGASQPEAGASLSFVDTSLPNVSTRYQYKVRLSLNSGANVFESDAIYAGLLSGSSVTSFEATKGTHDATVRLQWDAKQVGTDNTTYVISRRYVNTGSDFMRINSTSGSAAQYTYEDNTVQPGYYYEYKIEVFNGGVQQNTLYDVGFCQARGVISGRVTFGTGTAVDDVRLSLRPSNTGDDNTVQGYSQRVDGASTGIAWEADSAEIAKVFGEGKDFTVQMFVRPDEGLSEGAVIGEIPGEGQLHVGAINADGSYQLYCKKENLTVTTKTFTEVNLIRGITYHSDDASTSVIDEETGHTAYSEDEADDITNQWRLDEGANYYKRDFATNWWGTDVNTYVYTWKKNLTTPVSVTYTEGSVGYYDMGIALQPGVYSLLSVEQTGGLLSAMVNDSISTSQRLVRSVPVSLEEMSAPGYAMYNGQLVSFEGNLCPPLAEWMWNGYVHTTASTETMGEQKCLFSIGGAVNITAEQGFKGNFTEVRVWDHVLTEAEQSSYADRVLNGRETGLALYWPMDEGLERYAFDASYANDLPNGRHATVGGNIRPSNIVPADEQLSRYAMTNENGEYIIRGIPFVGSGSTYTLTPTRGIHEFNPQSRNGFIGNGSLTLNSYDFTDVSSFPVRGKVTYLDTNIPVDSVQFMIDGNLVQSKEGVRSDANGEYEISVPIGEHLLECYMNGHRFTSFPLDGSTYDFKRAETVNFVDSTVVNVTGRINGGFSDQSEPVGFRKSVNRVGKATIKLSLGKESQCSFNYITNDRGESDYGMVNIPVESATDSIQSTAYRAALKSDNTDTYYIYITTDPETGEFSALLPPLKYKVESIKFDGGDRYDDEPVFAQNLPVIDASNAIKERMKSDSLTVGSTTQKYEYSAKMIRQLRVEPTIQVYQEGQREGVFGVRTVEITNADYSKEMVTVTTVTDDGYTYHFGHPIFRQDSIYTFGIDIAEKYVNLDTQKEFTEIPSDAVIHIANDGSATTKVFGEKATIGNDEVDMGMAYETLNINVTPDEKGHVIYEWEAGWPNLATGHIHNLSISATVDGRTTMWQAPDSRAEALDMIVLGSIGSGTNFVTQGPDAVDMVIRRPPGSTSVATLTDKEIRSYSHTTVNSEGEVSDGGAYISETPTWEISTGTVLGIAVLEKSKFKIVLNQTIKTADKWSDSTVGVNDTTYTVTSSMATPSSMQIDLASMSYQPEGGDTYIGRSTNLLFSKGRILGIFKQDDGSYKIDEKSGICVGQTFGTTFVYPQAYILNTLIPNWQAIIKSRLEEGHIAADHTNAANCPVVPGKVIYYTKYNSDDPEFGRSNADIAYWTAQKIRQADGCPSYRMVNGTDDPSVQDEVQNAIIQIQQWRARIADNEKDKLDAFADAEQLIDNFSIATGTKVSQTTETSVKSGTTKNHETSYNFSISANTGAMFNDAGGYLICGTQTFDSQQKSDGSSATKSNSVAWTMSDSDPRTALSVDVYKSPSGWGPIFRTRGGQTANPYEGASYTKFYQEGTLLNEATMQVEKPQLRVKGAAEVTDVPTGGQAKFILELSNQSETNDICTYTLEVKERSNPQGAILTVDGNILSNGKDGRSIKMKGGETIEKTLIVQQSDPSIIDYNDIKLVLKSPNDPSIDSGDVTLRVHFVPSSAAVNLSVDHTVVNKAYVDENGGVTATIRDLNLQDEGLQGMRLRYRRKGTDSWTIIKQWAKAAELQQLGYDPMPTTIPHRESVSFLEDGIYELQAQTFGLYGTEEVTYESEIIEMTQDTHGPKILGMVSPENGQLTYLNRNNMHFRMNEQLNQNALSKSDNFRIEGGLNNVVYGESRYPDVAVQLNGNRIETEAMYDLANTDYAFDMWFYRQGDGTIISLGTDDNLLALSTHDGGKLRARVGTATDIYDANVVLPENKWTYMALDYKRKTADDPQNRITMLYATADDKAPVYVGKNVPANDLDGRGKLAIGGDGMQGRIAELSIWNSDVTAQQLYETRTMARAAYTPGLVGYWNMTEGHGTKITDLARSRHMVMPSESWYINNENRAAHLSGEEGSPLKIDIATFNPAKTDNFAYEMWFRGNEADNQGLATLMSVQNGSTTEKEVADTIRLQLLGQREFLVYKYKYTTTDTRTTIGFDEGKLKLKLTADATIRTDGSNETEYTTEVKNDVTLTDRNYLDGNWHHLAFNVRRGTSAIVYIDGEAVKVLPEASVLGISSHYLIVGGEQAPNDQTTNPQNDQTTNRFTGDVDELRIWNGALDGTLIADRMYDRLDSSYPGLVGYFPMEDIHRTVQGTITTDFSKENFGESDSRLKIENDLSQSVNAPALKPGSTKLRLDDSQFDFTASADEIYFSFPDVVLPQMDGNDFVTTVSYIKDEHGNNSEPVQWKFHADFASLKWIDSGLFVTEITKKWNETASTDAYIYNVAGSPQTYEISGQPSWMTVDKPVGTISDNLDVVTFTVGNDVPVGRYTEYIYLTDRLGIQRVLQINVTVKGDEPDWSVDPTLYESNMILTGQVYVADKISENTDTKIAFFDGMGSCRGVGSPRYVASRDAYYVDMVVYGGSSTDLSTGERELTAKMYDASTGKIYPVVYITKNDGTVGTTLTYAPDANLGSYDNPLVFRSSDDIQQSVSLPRNWSWWSVYVQPVSTLIADVLPQSKSELKKFRNIKSSTAYASAKSDGSEIAGTLENIVPGQMYKIQTSAACSFDIYGKTINLSTTEQTIYPGWNWIGSLSSDVLSPADAFADLAPQNGDMVKNRTSAAYYRDGIWEGTLQNIIPGEGYIYKSMATAEKTFHYPSHSSGSATTQRAKEALLTTTAGHYHMVDPHLYPDNMNIIAVVEKDGRPVDNAEVGAFIGDECRGAITCKSGYYFLTILGSSEDDAQKTIELRVFVDGEEYIFDEQRPFVSDAVIGTLDEPHMLDLNTTAIRDISSDTDDDDDWYTLQGFKIGRRPIRSGVYIHRGRKVTIK